MYITTFSLEYKVIYWTISFIRKLIKLHISHIEQHTIEWDTQLSLANQSITDSNHMTKDATNNYIFNFPLVASTIWTYIEIV